MGDKSVFIVIIFFFLALLCVNFSDTFRKVERKQLVQSQHAGKKENSQRVGADLIQPQN